jgi:hypothetical protein
MSVEKNQTSLLSPEEEQAMDVWAYQWYDAARAAAFIFVPYHPDESVIERLRDYFHAGLSPVEAAFACFGSKH